jgi:outer membrane protein assembly factor BamB
MRKSFVVVLLVVAAARTFTQSADWPCWRGPNHDGVSAETGWNPEALKGGAKVLWTVDIGAGYSNVAISQGRIYTMGKDKKTLAFTIRCLDASTGRQIWTNQALRIYGEVESTPAVDGDRVYGLGRDGTLFCLDAATGSLKWQKNMNADYHVAANSNSGYGWASSPIIDGDLVLINANSSGMAIDRLTGALVWLSDGTFNTRKQFFASPVPFGPPDSRTVLFLGPEKLSAVKAVTGDVLWSWVHREPLEVVADPIVQGARAWISQHEVAEMLEMNGLQVSLAWRTSIFRSGASSPVMVNGYLYGQDWAAAIDNWDWDTLRRVSWSFLCMDWATGAVKWSTPMKFVTASAADRKLLVLEITGTLHIADASQDGWHEYSSADVLKGANMPRLFATPPVLSGGRIYCRNYQGDLVCIDARK